MCVCKSPSSLLEKRDDLAASFVVMQTQGVVIPIGAVVTAATGVKKQSRGQGLFLVSVKRSRTIFKLGNSGQDINVLRVHIAHSVVKCVRSNGQGPVCGAVKRSSNKNDSQNFLTPVAAVTTAPMGVTTPCTAADMLSSRNAIIKQCHYIIRSTKHAVM